MIRNFLWRRVGLVVGALLSAVFALESPARIQVQEPKPAVPVDPIATIVDAFARHEIVALGEGEHGNEQGHTFRLSLIRDPRFAGLVNDIVVEFGSASNQDIMDRFVTGADIPMDRLRMVWQNTTQPTTVWDRPIYEEFVRAVRDVNQTLPSARRLRVLLGDPAIDWDTIRRPEQIAQATSDRGAHAIDLIRREVLARQRRALVIYGDAHVWRRSPLSMVRRLEVDSAVRVFAITTLHVTDMTALQSDVGSWAAPRLALLAGTVLGEAAFRAFIPVPGDQGRLQDNADALLFLGPPSGIGMSQLPRALCADSEYMEMRLGRLALAPRPPAAPDLGQELRRYCASLKSQ